jgi:hypothetical protein
MPPDAMYDEIRAHGQASMTWARPIAAYASSDTRTIATARRLVYSAPLNPVLYAANAWSGSRNNRTTRETG